MCQAWYVLHSKPNREAFLSAQLEHRKINVFFPQLRVNPVNPRARKVKPLFPGYLFIQIDLDQTPVSSLAYVPGVRSLVSFDNEPASVTNEVILALRKNVDCLNRQTQTAKPGLQHGDPVVILDGPFKGYEAIFDTRIHGSDRVRLLVKMMRGQQKRVQVPAKMAAPKKP